MSESVSMVERYTMSEDETELNYEIVITDPDNLWSRQSGITPGSIYQAMRCCGYRARRTFRVRSSRLRDFNIQMMSNSIAKAAICLLVAASAANAQGPDGSRPNFLVILGDDMGVETLASFGVGTQTPRTATLDALAERGVRFNSMWSQAMCSPTRATILTGRYGFRTGVGGPTGDNVARGAMPEPPPGTGRSHRVRHGRGHGNGRDGRGYRHRRPVGGLPWTNSRSPRYSTHVRTSATTRPAIGKWHLADVRNGWQDHPNLVGFDHFSGLVRCCVESYFAWVHLENGEFSTRTGYAVSDKVDDAIEWLGDASEREAPWFLWLAFNTPHTPIHMPPRDLLQSDFSDFVEADAEQGDPRYFDAMMEAMDTEIGRLLDHIGTTVLENTHVLFIGDNGTGSNAVRAPFRPGFAKGSVYNGGIHVPFIVAGPGVASGASADALVNSADLFATILELAGIDIAEAVPAGIALDSVSLVPYLSDPGRESIREWIYADAFSTELGVRSGEYTMRNDRYKLLVDQGVEHFFDLQEDPYEHSDLMAGDLSEEQQAQLDALRAQIDALHGSEG